MAFQRQALLCYLKILLTSICGSHITHTYYKLQCHNPQCNVANAEPMQPKLWLTIIFFSKLLLNFYRLVWPLVDKLFAVDLSHSRSNTGLYVVYLDWGLNLSLDQVHLCCLSIFVVEYILHPEQQLTTTAHRSHG